MAINGMFVLDAVTHMYNLTPENFGEDRGSAELLTGLAYAISSGDPKYALPQDAYCADWSTDDVMAILFGESATDVAITHPLPIYAFKDGMSALEKSVEALEKYPKRVVGAYACVDPLAGKDAFRAMEEQVELLNPLGFKVYPTSWHNGVAQNWRMDDPEIAFPFFEKAQELGINHVAIHKAVPTGLVPIGDEYGAKDVEGAAYRFPDMTFEIVHGGLAFVEETGIIMGRHSNVWINLEVWNAMLMYRPRVFAKLLCQLIDFGGMPVLDRLLWGSGSMMVHPRPALEAFAEFEIPQDLLDSHGMFGPLEQLTDDHKRGILGENYARLHGLDIEQFKAGIEGDQFSRPEGAPLPDPYSTTSKADVAPKAVVA